MVPWAQVGLRPCTSLPKKRPCSFSLPPFAKSIVLAECLLSCTQGLTCFLYGAETGLFYAAGTCKGAHCATVLCRTDVLRDITSFQQSNHLCSVKLANERHDQLLIIARSLQRLECVPLAMALSIVCCRPPESKPKLVDMDKQNLGT